MHEDVYYLQARMPMPTKVEHLGFLSLPTDSQPIVANNDKRTRLLHAVKGLIEEVL